MARNVELKAKARDFGKQKELAKALGDGSWEELLQEDTFFQVPRGRLKLREFGDGYGELIQYERSDTKAPKLSRYIRTVAAEPEALKQALSNALGIRSVVKKRRLVVLVGQTRIHLDEVEGLGQFLELEVVLRPEETLEFGTVVAQELAQKLEIAQEDLLDQAYADLLEQEAGLRGP